MTNLPIPLAVLYAGLAGTVLALIIATIQNKWSPRVFFLLALRLAIGWHFLFEGLYKVNSHSVGPTETNRPFTSEPYFRAAPGPIGAIMRRQFEDPVAAIDARVKAPNKEIKPEDFARMSVEKQAAECPKAVADALDRMEPKAVETAKAAAEKLVKEAEAAEAKELAAVDAAEKKATEAAKTDEEKVKAKAKADADRAKVKENAMAAWDAARKEVDAAKEGGQALLTAAKATYARWVYGVDGRPTKLKAITGRDSATGDVLLTARQRLEHIEWLRKELAIGEAWRSPGLGNGTGTDTKRIAAVRTDLLTAESELAKDANAFITELKTGLAGGKAPEEEKTVSQGQRLDTITMWFLVGIGACLMGGLFTRLACVLAAGFLVTTYLLHPPFPWYPLPPGTEGNPVFINKNVIEALALLVLACYPTGRWLGLDAVVLRPFCRYHGEDERPPEPPKAAT